MIKELAKYLLLAVVVGCIASWAIAQMKLDTSFFSKGTFTSSLVTFSTGAMLSIFLTVFHSNNEKLVLFREKHHAKTLYMLVVISNALIVLLSGLTDSQKVVIFGIGLDSLAITISTALGVLLTWFVVRIIGLFFSRTR